MATRTLTQLQTEVRERTEQENSTFVSDSELTGYINHAYAKTYAILKQSYGEDYFVSSHDITADGSETYALPSDFSKCLGVDINLTSGYRKSIEPFAFNDRNKVNELYYPSNSTFIGEGSRYRIRGDYIWFRPSLSSGTSVTIHYVPALTELVSGSDTVSLPAMAIDYLVKEACLPIKIKLEDDIQPLLIQIREAKADLSKSCVMRVQEGTVVSDPYCETMAPPWD